MKRAPRQFAMRGVSMLEVMIVIAVLGIIGALAVPMFSGTDATRLTSAASILVADIEVARAESIAHSDDPRMLVFDANDTTWHLAARSAPATPLNHPETGLPYSRTLGQGELKQLLGVSISDYDLDTASETNDNKLGFGIYGQTDQADDPSITLRSGENVLTLTINATTGEVTIGQVN